MDSANRPVSARLNFIAGLSLLPRGCTRFAAEHERALVLAPGSGSNHQHWEGGYLDHVDEIFALAASFHQTLSRLRPLPFTLPDALLVLFLHDLEKIFNRVGDDIITNSEYAALGRTDPHTLQERMIADYGLTLSSAQRNALKYIHGEGDDYRKDKRAAGELAAFCHLCDYWSARGWHDQPQASTPLPGLISPSSDALR
jgi:hypothetical protein